MWDLQQEIIKDARMEQFNQQEDSTDAPQVQLKKKIKIKILGLLPSILQILV